MFYEYALEPAVLGDWSSVRLFLDAFGPSKGRFLAQYPRKWKRMVYEHVGRVGAGDVARKRIEERLRLLDKRVFSARSESSFDPEQTWLENATREHSRDPFRAIISREASGMPEVLEADAVDESNPLWSVDHGRLVSRRPELFAAALRLLLKASSHVLLVDPYFRGRHTRKVEVVAALCGELDAKSTKVEVHNCLQDEDPDDDP